MIDDRLDDETGVEERRQAVWRRGWKENAEPEGRNWAGKGGVREIVRDIKSKRSGKRGKVKKILITMCDSRHEKGYLDIDAFSDKPFRLNFCTGLHPSSD